MNTQEITETTAHNLTFTDKTSVRVDRSTLTPIDPVPLQRRHKFFFQLALLYLGERGQEISKAEIRDRALLHLKFVSMKFFDNSSWDQTLVRSLDGALEAVSSGKNNLHRCQAQTDGPFELRV